MKGSSDRLGVEGRMSSELEELLGSAVARVTASINLAEVVGGMGVNWYGQSNETATK